MNFGNRWLQIEFAIWKTLKVMMITILSNKWTIGLVVPLIFFVISGLAKALARSSGIRWEDWYLGVELILAALSSTLLYVVDLARKVNLEKVMACTVFTVLLVLFLVVQLLLHRTFGDSMTSEIFPKRVCRFIMIGVCNCIGFVFLGGFIVFLKGI